MAALRVFEVHENMLWIFNSFKNRILMRGKFWKFDNHTRSHQKFGPDRFGRFNAYWIQTDRQKDRQTSTFINRSYLKREH